MCNSELFAAEIGDNVMLARPITACGKECQLPLIAIVLNPSSRSGRTTSHGYGSTVRAKETWK